MIIYCITNKINDKKYVGQTVRRLQDRWSEHCSGTDSDNIAVDRAIKKYGKENFLIDVIDTAVSLQELNEKEIFWIERLQTLVNGYNLVTGGKNYHRSDASRKRLSDSHKRSSHRPPSQKGVKRSQELRDRLSISHRGRAGTYGMLGKHFTDEQKQRISQACKLAWERGQK